jgi:hypothetical protein
MGDPAGINGCRDGSYPARTLVTARRWIRPYEGPSRALEHLIWGFSVRCLWGSPTRQPRRAGSLPRAADRDARNYRPFVAEAGVNPRGRLRPLPSIARGAARGMLRPDCRASRCDVASAVWKPRLRRQVPTHRPSARPEGGRSPPRFLRATSPGQHRSLGEPCKPGGICSTFVHS